MRFSDANASYTDCRPLPKCSDTPSFRTFIKESSMKALIGVTCSSANTSDRIDKNVAMLAVADIIASTLEDNKLFSRIQYIFLNFWSNLSLNVLIEKVLI